MNKTIVSTLVFLPVFALAMEEVPRLRNVETEIEELSTRALLEKYYGYATVASLEAASAVFVPMTNINLAIRRLDSLTEHKVFKLKKRNDRRELREGVHLVKTLLNERHDIFQEVQRRIGNNVKTVVTKTFEERLKQNLAHLRGVQDSLVKKVSTMEDASEKAVLLAGHFVALNQGLLDNYLLLLETLSRLKTM